MQRVDRVTGPSPLSLALADIKLAHSVFALPFAVLAAFLATPATDPRLADRTGLWAGFAVQLALVVACMVAARSWAMLVNRLADRRFDAANPRTARRPLASGALAVRHAAALAALAAGAFVLCCAAFWLLFDNPWPAILSLPTLAWIGLYSFTKRFTRWSHLFLGSSLAFAPIAAAIAVHPPALLAVPAIHALAASVLLWVAGFDILYALQDTDFDRSAGLHSLPAKLGPHNAVRLSRVFHILSTVFLVLATVLDPRLGVAFLITCLGVATLLFFEHWYLTKAGLKGLPLAFGVVNGCISLAVGLIGILEVL